MKSIRCSLGIHLRVPVEGDCCYPFACSHYRCLRCDGHWSLLLIGMRGQPRQFWMRLAPRDLSPAPARNPATTGSGAVEADPGQGPGGRRSVPRQAGGRTTP